MYPALFARAFGDPRITTERVGKALAQFTRSMGSCGSRYDEGRTRARSAKDDFDNFTRQENRGKALFMRNCSTCHMRDGNEHFFVQIPANTGLRGNESTADGGVGDSTLRAADLGSFKSPSLRNVEVTAPYGHDGRFPTLDAVIDHYSDTAIVDANLGYANPAGPMQFTASEKAALIAFLETLTDRAFLTDPRFSSPFVVRKDAVERVKRTVLAARAALVKIGASIPQGLAVLRSAVLVTEMPPAPAASRPTPSDIAIQRLMSFDADRNLRISREELPQRMEGLLARGDRNGDAVLDSNEMESLVDAAAFVVPTCVVFHRQPSDGLPGVINDLRLSPAKHARALAIVSSQKPVSGVSLPPNSDLYARMKALLDDEEYGNFAAGARRLSGSPRIIR